MFRRIRDYFRKRDKFTLVLILTVTISSVASTHAWNNWVSHTKQNSKQTQTNSQQINADHNKIVKLEGEVKKVSSTPPVVIVQKPIIIKEEKHAKPFADPELLHRAHRLRHEQISTYTAENR